MQNRFFEDFLSALPQVDERWIGEDPIAHGPAVQR